MAFFNTDFYKDVATNWTGCGALYIFLLTSVAWMISAVAIFAPLSQLSKNTEMNVYIDQLPHMTIQDSKLSIDKPVPYEIKEPATGQALALFATNRTTDTMLKTDPPVVITANAVLTRETEETSKYATDTKDGVTKILKFSDVSQSIPKFELDGKIVKDLIAQVCLWVPIGVFFIGWPAVFLGHLFQLLIYGGIGMAIASGMEKKVPFETAMRLAAIAITPCIIVTVLLTLLRLAVPAAAMLGGIWAFGSIGVALGYMFWELSSIDSPGQQSPSALR